MSEVTHRALLPIDDPNRPLNDSALPLAMISAGGDAYDDLTMPGVAERMLDLDSCAVAVGIYRAMTEASMREVAAITVEPRDGVQGKATTFHRFNGAAAWAALDDAQRAAIGAHALELVLVWHLQDLEGPGPESALPVPFARVASAAENLLMTTFEDLVRDSLPDDAFTAPDGQPRVPSLLGGICRVCACSHHDPCPKGCGWAGEDLCTACADREAAE